MASPAAPRIEVGRVLKLWMDRMELNPSALAHFAQLSRATVYTVLANKPVSPETLRKLAEGLTRDHAGGYADPATVSVIQRELFRAGGYESLLEPVQSSDSPATDIIDYFTRHLVDPIFASRFATLIRRWHLLDSHDKSVITAIVQASYQRLNERSNPSIDEAMDIEANIAAGAGQDYIRAWHRLADLSTALQEETDRGDIDSSTSDWRKRAEEVDRARDDLRRLAKLKTRLIEDVISEMDDASE